MRKSTFLADPLWKTVPFSTHPKTPIDRLVDLLLEAPGILAKADRFDALKSPVLRLWSALDMFEYCYNLGIQMRSFYVELEAAHPGTTLYWEQSPLNTQIRVVERNHEEQMLLGSDFEFTNIQIASVLMLYWATTTMLHSGMCHIHEFLTQVRNQLSDEQLAELTVFKQPEQNGYMDLSRLPPLGDQRNFVLDARKVFRSVEFCLRDCLSAQHDFGLSAVTAPLQIVVDTLKDWPFYETEVRWGYRALLYVQQRGVRMVQFDASGTTPSNKISSS